MTAEKEPTTIPTPTPAPTPDELHLLAVVQSIGADVVENAAWDMLHRIVNEDINNNSPATAAGAETTFHRVTRVCELLRLAVALDCPGIRLPQYRMTDS